MIVGYEELGGRWKDMLRKDADGGFSFQDIDQYYSILRNINGLLNSSFFENQMKSMNSQQKLVFSLQ